MWIAYNKTWLLCVVLFGLHQFSQYYLGWSVPFLDNYLDPFLGIPCLLGLVLQERRFLLDRYIDKRQAAAYCFSALDVVVITFILAVLFEEGFPRWSDNFTRDNWDYVAYFLGAGLFYFLVNIPQQKAPK
ncbi:MAG: hypothetical protein AAF960_07610 [Bacteroidota bacterium]